jgi:DNA-binding transcriptional MerR regulator
MNRAAVAIPEKLFFKIGEVCELTGVQAHVLRYWESEFPMLAPQKNRAGQRTYRKRDVEMALRIKELLYDDQYTIAGAKKKLTGELRGASKLKVVSPEMSVAQSVPKLSPPPRQEGLLPGMHIETRMVPNENPPERTRGNLSDEHSRAVRRLAGQLRELLAILENGGTVRKPENK